MNILTLILIVNFLKQPAAHYAIESFLTELTLADPTMTITYDTGRSPTDPFRSYTVRTDLDQCQVNHLAHQILNDFQNETGTWNQPGNVRKLRRRLILKCSVWPWVRG